jgi:hypothetical protein
MAVLLVMKTSAFGRDLRDTDDARSVTLSIVPDMTVQVVDRFQP